MCMISRILVREWYMCWDRLIFIALKYIYNSPPGPRADDLVAGDLNTIRGRTNPSRNVLFWLEMICLYFLNKLCYNFMYIHGFKDCIHMALRNKKYFLKFMDYIILLINFILWIVNNKKLYTKNYNMLFFLRGNWSILRTFFSWHL